MKFSEGVPTVVVSRCSSPRGLFTWLGRKYTPRLMAVLILAGTVGILSTPLGTKRAGGPGSGSGLRCGCGPGWHH